jgi:hypothetical protein
MVAAPAGQTAPPLLPLTLVPLTLAQLLPLTLAGLVPLAECPCSTRHWTIRRARMP